MKALWKIIDHSNPGPEATHSLMAMNRSSHHASGDAIEFHNLAMDLPCYAPLGSAPVLLVSAGHANVEEPMQMGLSSTKIFVFHHLASGPVNERTHTRRRPW